MRDDPESTPEAALSGDQRNTPDELAVDLYDDLRRIASSYFAAESNRATLQPTALVHEAYMRLADQTAVDWEDQAHFRAAAARTMRRVLVDAARSRGRAKRGGHFNRISLIDDVQGQPEQEVDCLDLEEAFVKLADVNERYLRIVEMRYYGGLTVPDVAKLLKISERQVFKDWNVARSYLALFLEGDEETE